MSNPSGKMQCCPDLRILWLNRMTTKKEWSALRTSRASVARSVEWTVSACLGQ